MLGLTVQDYIFGTTDGTTLSEVRFKNTSGSSVITGVRILLPADAAWSATGVLSSDC